MVPLAEGLPGRGSPGTARPASLRRDVRFGAAVYGSFLAASVVGVSYEAGESARSMTLSPFASMLVFWAAHAWSEVVGERIARGPAFRPAAALAIARREWPLVEAAVLPTVLLALAWAGVWSREAGARLAFAAAVVQVAGWGVLAARRSGCSWPAAILVAGVEATLATLLLLLERLVH
jgi:hypothetical protein